jgi:hypothetical protein
LPELVGQLLLSAQAPPDQLPQGAFLFNHFGDVTEMITKPTLWHNLITTQLLRTT